MDFFVGIYNVNYANSKGRIGIYNANPSKLNSSPSTTGIVNPPIIQYTPVSNKNSDQALINFSIDKATDAKFGSLDDYYLSFKIPVKDINLAMQMANKSIRVNANTPLRYIVGTAAQDNSFNQDVAGIQGFNSRSTTTWTDLGVYTPITSPSGTGTSVHFHNGLASTSPVYTMTRLTGYSLGTLPTLASPNAAGKYFAGWTTVENGASADFSPTTVVTGTPDPLDLFAVWSSNVKP